MIIGVGNRFRQDDGVGPWVVDRLRELGRSVLEHSGEGAGLIELWSGAAAVILIDATQSGAPPGTIRRLDAATVALPKALFRYSSHLFGVAEAIETARALNRLPPALTVYGIEGARFGFGADLSPEVVTAAAAVVEEIARAVTDTESPA